MRGESSHLEIPGIKKIKKYLSQSEKKAYSLTSFCNQIFQNARMSEKQVTTWELWIGKVKDENGKFCFSLKRVNV